MMNVNLELSQPRPTNVGIIDRKVANRELLTSHNNTRPPCTDIRYYNHVKLGVANDLR